MLSAYHALERERSGSTRGTVDASVEFYLKRAATAQCVIAQRNLHRHAAGVIVNRLLVRWADDRYGGSRLGGSGRQDYASLCGDQHKHRAGHDPMPLSRQELSRHVVDEDSIAKDWFSRMNSHLCRIAA